MGTSPWVGQLRAVEAAAGKLPVWTGSAGVDVALLGAHPSTDGFYASVTGRSWVHFCVSGE